MDHNSNTAVVVRLDEVLSSLSFLSRMRFATLYDTLPRIKPITTGGIDWDRSNAYSMRENVNAAISTQLPKAIVAAMMLL